MHLLEDEVGGWDDHLHTVRKRPRDDGPGVYVCIIGL